MKRREFVGGLAGAVAWPFVVSAQERTRKVGLLLGLSEKDPEAQRRLKAFLDTLRELGWTEGGNVKIETRWASGIEDKFAKHATELAALTPDVILATGNPSALALQRSTQTIPIVFLAIVDPVGSGIVKSLAEPGGNLTGFMSVGFDWSGKLLEFLKQAAPALTRVGVLRDATNPTGMAQFAAAQLLAPSLGVVTVPINLGHAEEIRASIANLAAQPNAGLIVTGGPSNVVRRNLIIDLTNQFLLPSASSDRTFAAEGGLLAYGHNRVEPYQQAALYVDRILRGERPASLPVQASTKYELVINLRTAKALGLPIPPSLLARADEVIE